MCGFKWEDKKSWKYYDQVTLDGYDSTEAANARSAFKSLVEAKSGGAVLNLSGRISSCWEAGDGTNAWMLSYSNGKFQVLKKQNEYNRLRPVKRF